MEKFLDSEGREWSIRLTAGKCTRIRDASGIDLYVKVGDDGQWDFSAFDLYLNPRKFLDVLWTLIEDEAKCRSVTREQFEDTVDVATYRNAKVAFGDEVNCFSPMPAALQSKMRELIRETVGETTDRPTDSTSNGSATNSAGPSESTRDPLRIAS